ncbi:MAG: hypothetical protein HY378_00855 [Candidatus Brennerbacteria bacterium]|nr:hypothetical protein [Candidatus Brennerbacteria bacterium]
MEIKVVKEPIKKSELMEMAKKEFGNLIKAVVDVKQEIMAVGGQLHADEETFLTEKEGSEREYTWGINLRLDESGDGFIEFDSMINLKPGFGNRSRGVDDPKIQEQIKEVVGKLVTNE